MAMRSVSVGVLLVACAVAWPVAVVWPVALEAQQRSDLVVAVGGGGTYYCIITRCGTGGTVVGLVGYGLAPSLMVVASGRWHDCFDCRRFLVAEGSLQLRHRGRRMQPFVAAGVGVSSDPDFMGDKVGLHAAVGTWLWLSPRWGLQAELRGRQVGRGDAMAELSLTVARRFLAGPS